MTDEREKNDKDVDVFEQSEGDRATDIDPSFLALPSSAMLSVEDADALLRRRAASLIAVVGERNGGKTTLITEIYERFLRGPFADALFCNSLSLLGFERKSFQSRAISGAERPDTPRTSAQDGLQFFHLAVSDPNDLKRTDLLISERAGEAYRNVRDRPTFAVDLIEVRKADTVAFIIDGERVADDFRRAEAFASVRNTVRALVDADVIRNHAQVQLVTTKCDLLDGEATAGALEALSELEDRVSAMLVGRFEVAKLRTAARDPEGRVEPARGLAPLLRSWLRTTSPVFDLPPTPELSDEFDRLFVRRGD